MSNKTGTAFDKEQVTDLSAAVKALCNNIQSQWDETSKIFNELRGEDIIGESEQKAPIIESINIAEDNEGFGVLMSNHPIAVAHLILAALEHAPEGTLQHVLLHLKNKVAGEQCN